MAIKAEALSHGHHDVLRLGRGEKEDFTEDVHGSGRGKHWSLYSPLLSTTLVFPASMRKTVPSALTISGPCRGVPRRSERRGARRRGGRGVEASDAHWLVADWSQRSYKANRCLKL